jgi:hypothetical protein
MKKERYNKIEKSTNLGMTLRAVLISHFERMTYVPGPKADKKQKETRPAA